MILLLEPLHPDAVEVLSAQEPVRCVEDPEAALEVARQGNISAILTRGKGRVTAALMHACGSSLRVASRAGAGVDTVDVPVALSSGIAVVYAPGINAATTAEQTFLLMLAITRQAYSLAQNVRAGNWAIRNTYEGFELRGRTLGIIGMGAIGVELARRARAFDMTVQFASRSEKVVAGCEQVPLEKLLATSDVVSLHAPLNATTRGMLGARELGQMKRGAYLVNAARGALVDKAALNSALENGHLAGYAADVFDPQPPAAEDLALINRANVLLTPHVAGLTDKTYREVCLYCARNVVAILRGETPDPRSIFKL